jgi:hypothetical protein
MVKNIPPGFVAALRGRSDLTDLTWTPAQAQAVVEYWRANTIRVVEKVAVQFRADIENREG